MRALRKKHHNFLEERSDKPNEKDKYLYKHRCVCSAAASIKRYYEYIFTYEKYSELNIEKRQIGLRDYLKNLRINYVLIAV